MRFTTYLVFEYISRMNDVYYNEDLCGFVDLIVPGPYETYEKRGKKLLTVGDPSKEMFEDIDKTSKVASTYIKDTIQFAQMFLFSSKGSHKSFLFGAK